MIAQGGTDDEGVYTLSKMIDLRGGMLIGYEEEGGWEVLNGSRHDHISLTRRPTTLICISP